ncbi:hypothetical protein HY339_01280 [Candidatus Gottesmanbacteria bacterium]|nr:hypothetical protein [Candidatus Gottesmanbacteria bacterium]
MEHVHLKYSNVAKHAGVERSTVFVISILIAAVNQLPVIIQWVNNKPGELFTGIPHFFADYFLYVGQVAQGAAGRWLFAEHLFTNEPMAPTWYYWFYVTIGHLGNLAGLSPFATYNVSLFFLVVALVSLWYSLCWRLFPTSRLGRWMCFLFILTASNLPGLGQFWFSPGPSFNRLGGVPYHVFVTIVFLLFAVSVHKRSLVSTPFAIIAGMANPVQFLLFTLAAIAAKVRFAIIPVALGAVSVWLTNQEFARQSVFVAARAWELAQRVPNTVLMLIPAIGPMLLFVPFGWKNATSKTDPLRLLFIAYGLLSFALFLTPIPRLLGVSPVRFLGPLSYPGLAIFATQGLLRLGSRQRIAALALYGALTTVSLYGQLVDRITPARNPQLLMDTIYNHVPLSYVDALSWLKTQRQGVVLTDPAIPIEVLVPVFSGKISFSGHPIHTLYPEVKEALRQDFFSGRMSEAQQKQFLTDHHIGYIISSRMLSSYTKVFSNDTIFIYGL